MQKVLYVKNKGLSITAGIIMLLFAVSELMCLLTGKINFSLKNYQSYLFVLSVAAMFTFAILAIVLVNKNMMPISIPAILYLLIESIFLFDSLVHIIKSATSSSDILLNLFWFLFPFAVLVFFVLFVLKPAAFLIPLIVFCTASLFYYLLYYRGLPDVVGYLKAFGLWFAMNDIVQRFIMLPFLLFSISLSHKKETQKTGPIPK